MEPGESEEQQRERTSWLATLAFVVVALPAGLLFAIITPPFRVPDEVGHFWRACAIAHGDIAPQSGPGGSGSEIPLGLKKFVQIFWRDASTPEEFNRYTYLIGWREPLAAHTLTRVNYPTQYLPVVYAPQVAAAVAGETFRLRPIITFYLGRLFTLVAFIAIVALAVRATPVAPWAFATAALFPMTLYLAASWSADPMINAFMFLFVSLTMRAIAATALMNWREVSALAVVAFGLGSGKLPFATCGLLLLAIPKTRFATRRSRAVKVGSVAAFLAAGVAMATYAWRSNVGALRAGVDMPGQLALSTGNPLHFPAVFVRDLATNGSEYLQQMVGRLGMLDLRLPGWLITIELTALIAAALLSMVTPGAKTRVLAGLSVAIAMFGIALALYLGWTPVGGPTIEGIQGRYLIALLPAAIVVITTGTLRKLKWLPFAICGVWVVSLATALRLVLNRYYP